MMENKDSLVMFLKTGRLGSLSVFSLKNEVFTLLGTPNAVFYPYEYQGDTTSLEELSYGDISFVFLKGELIQIIIDFDEKDLGFPPVLEAKWGDMVKTMTAFTFVEFLQKNSINCKCIVNEQVEPFSLLWLEEADIDVTCDSDDNYKITRFIICRDAVQPNRKLANCW